MRNLRLTAALFAVLISFFNTHLYAQNSARGSTQITRIIIGTGPDASVGFTGVGTVCTDYSTSYYSPSTNTQIACVNTNPLNVTNRGTWTIVNSGGTSGLPSSGTNTIPYVVAGGNTQPATGANIGSLFTGSGAFLRADGTKADVTSGSSLPLTNLLLRGNNNGSAVAANAADVASLFSGGGAYLKTDGTTGTPSGSALPLTLLLLKGNNSGGAVAASASDVASLFSGVGLYLKADGTTGTPTGGGASAPTTPNLLAGDNAGGIVAATYQKVVSLFGLGACSGFIKSDGTCSTSTSTIPSYATASIPASGSAGQLAFSNDNSGGLPLYIYNPSGQSYKLLDSGPTGALNMTVAGQIDIVTSVVPRLGANNPFSGRNSFDAGQDLKTQAAPSNPASGYLTLYANNDGSFHVRNASGTDAALATGASNPNVMTTLGDQTVGGVSGAPTRVAIGAQDQVWTVGEDGQAHWQTPAATAGSSYSNLTQNGSGQLVASTSSSERPFVAQGTTNNVGYSILCSSPGTSNGDCHNVSLVSRSTATVVDDDSVGHFLYGYFHGSDGTFGGKFVTFGRLNVLTPGTQPGCDSGHRGDFWTTNGGTGVADKVEVCAKDASEAYSWKAIY